MLFYEGNVSTLKENEVFVFGSNPEGRHGAGAAKVAMNKFGAIYSKGRGLYGQSYALPTKNLTENYEEQISSRKVIKYKKAGFRSISKDQIKSNIKDFYKVARKEKDKVFYIAYKNDSKNLNGYSSEEMIEMFFEGFRLPKNIVFSNTFEDLLKEKGYLKEDKYKIVMDGIEHLNVYSKAKTVLGRKLTNMSNVSFNIEIEGKIINFKSLEGYWYFLKKKLLLKEKDLKYSEYDCFEAKDRGKKELKDLSLSKSDYEVFQKKIKESLRLKVEQNSDIQRLMIMNDLKYVHYYYYGEKEDSKIILKEDSLWIMEELESIGSNLKKEFNITINKNKESTFNTLGNNEELNIKFLRELYQLKFNQKKINKIKFKKETETTDNISKILKEFF